MIRKENIETEYKFIVKDKVVLIDVLNNLATIKKVHEFQVNKMFDNPDHLMKTSNGRIRVRNFGKGKKLFTYKKPLMSKSGAKREIEYQVDVIDKNDSLEKIF
jgi:adenylate cyclase class IV